MKSTDCKRGGEMKRGRPHLSVIIEIAALLAEWRTLIPGITPCNNMHLVLITHVSVVLGSGGEQGKYGHKVFHSPEWTILAM